MFIDAAYQLDGAQSGFAQKVDPTWNEPVSTGNAGALARYEREARKQSLEG